VDIEKHRYQPHQSLQRIPVPFPLKIYSEVFQSENTLYNLSQSVFMVGSSSCSRSLLAMISWPKCLRRDQPPVIREKQGPRTCRSTRQRKVSSGNHIRRPLRSRVGGGRICSGFRRTPTRRPRRYRTCPTSPGPSFGSSLVNRRVSGAQRFGESRRGKPALA
jgi:hypothetical protein